MGEFTSTVIRNADAAHSERLMSVDALRGFDMFWIIGASTIVAALDKMNENPVTTFLASQLKHVEWEGFHLYDLIFPLFLALLLMRFLYKRQIFLRV